MFDLSPIEAPDLSGKTILVTGAGRGIGAALARLLADKGARVYAGVFGGVDPTSAGLLDGCLQMDLDVTDRSSVDSAIARITSDATASSSTPAPARRPRRWRAGRPTARPRRPRG